MIPNGIKTHLLRNVTRDLLTTTVHSNLLGKEVATAYRHVAKTTNTQVRSNNESIIFADGFNVGKVSTN